ncbi:MAG: MAPEG family protein [Alphaproteobacteria bacterium]|nr:MAPEG family protein [Alphaproteobacteria bacterium]
MILEQFPLTALSTVVTLMVYFYCIAMVGKARAKHGIKPPSVDGPEEFQRVNRVHQNMVEQLVFHLPALWLFAAAWGDMGAGILGAIFAIGRILYARGYYEAAEKRGRGFGLSTMASVILLLGALAGVVMAIL